VSGAHESTKHASSTLPCTFCPSSLLPCQPQRPQNNGVEMRQLQANQQATGWLGGQGPRAVGAAAATVAVEAGETGREGEETERGVRMMTHGACPQD
jgi:hypothetical protein